MNDEIKVRPFKRADRAFMLRLITDAWDYYEWVPARAVNALGGYYMYELLAHSDAAWVAEVDGRAAGVIACGDRTRVRVRPAYQLMRGIEALSMELRRAGIMQFHQFVRTQRLDRELLARSGMSFDAELTLLITASAFRGRGVGGALYGRFEQWMRERGLNSYCLFTDSACEFGFYERRGMRRLAEKTFLWQDADGVPRYPEEYFLYGASCEEIGSRGACELPNEERES